MLYESSCCGSPEEPDRLQILIAGRPLPYAEAMRWQRVLFGKRKILSVICTLLVGLFLLDALSLLLTGDWYWFEKTAMALLLPAAAAITIGSLVALLRLPRKEALCRYAVYAADNEFHAVRNRIAFYGDRLTVSTVRGERVLYFSKIEACVETVDGFALTDGYDWVILRAQDMISYDAQLIHDYLATHVGSPVMQVKARARAELAQPLPILRVTQPEPVAQAALPYELSTVFGARLRQRRCRLAGASASLSFLAGMIVACYVSVTPWFLLDVFLCGSILAAVGTAFSALVFSRLCSRLPGGRVLTVRFFPDGVSIGTENAQQFCRREGLYVTAAAEGVWLHFGQSETLFVPFQAIDNPDAVKILVGIPTNSDKE